MNVGNNPVTAPIVTGVRHMLDADVTFGTSSSRYDEQNQYRTKYSPAQRVAAGMGTAFAVAVPAMAAKNWIARGAHVPLAHAGLQTNLGRGVVGAVLVGGAVAGGVKSMQIAKDDGHYGAIGAAAGSTIGAVAGMALGARAAGIKAPLVAGLGMAALGTAGYLAGRAVKNGPGHIGEPVAKSPRIDASAQDRAVSFASGAFNHWNEVGPVSQGLSFGGAWGMNKVEADTATQSERAGGMHADIAAAAILGGGALAMVKGSGIAAAAVRRAAATRSTYAGPSALRALGDGAGKVLSEGIVTSGALTKLQSRGSVAGATAAAVAIAGLTSYKAYEQTLDGGHGSQSKANLVGAGMLAATGATALALSRTATIRGMRSTAAGGATSALLAASLMGVASAVMAPARQFRRDSQGAIAADGGVKYQGKGGIATAVGAGALGVGAYGALPGFIDKVVPNSKYKTLAVVGGTLAATAAGGYIGRGLSATMPDDPKRLRLSVAAGAAVGVGVGALLHRPRFTQGAAAGALLGLSASSLAGD